MPRMHTHVASCSFRGSAWAPRHDDLVTALELADYGVPVEIHEGARKAITDEIVLDWHRAEWAAAVPTISSR